MAELRQQVDRLRSEASEADAPMGISRERMPSMSYSRQVDEVACQAGAARGSADVKHVTQSWLVMDSESALLLACGN